MRGSVVWRTPRGSRSSHKDSCRLPASARLRIAGARSVVIQSSPAGLRTSSIRASVIMPLSPTNPATTPDVHNSRQTGRRSDVPRRSCWRMLPGAGGARDVDAGDQVCCWADDHRRWATGAGRHVVAARRRGRRDRGRPHHDARRHLAGSDHPGPPDGSR
jgi:hypothetical protein